MFLCETQALVINFRPLRGRTDGVCDAWEGGARRMCFALGCPSLGSVASEAWCTRIQQGLAESDLYRMRREIIVQPVDGHVLLGEIIVAQAKTVARHREDEQTPPSMWWTALAERHRAVCHCHVKTQIGVDPQTQGVWVLVAVNENRLSVLECRTPQLELSIV